MMAGYNFGRVHAAGMKIWWQVRENGTPGTSPTGPLKVATITRPCAQSKAPVDTCDLLSANGTF
ncbi:hypothetical protein EFR01_58650 [Sinorhizobium fredii]|nr:hypothetical protein EFR01_58650 [Sinorhizobium fredii]GLS11899.1 hypothetical protein GCM10007864_55310 [Sinorhizobium fredii]